MTTPTTGGQKFRIVIIDDHPIVRKGVGQLINGEPDMELVAEAEDSAGAFEALEAHRPDVAIVDLSLARENGITLVKRMTERFEGLPILVLSMHDESLHAERVIRAGAHGYVMKDADSDILLDAIRKVAGGNIYLSPTLSTKLLQGLVHGNPFEKAGPLHQLTDRETEVYELIGAGLTTRQIAESLGVSVKTVESHRGKIKRKLHVDSSAELMRLAVKSTMSPLD